MKFHKSIWIWILFLLAVGPMTTTARAWTPGRTRLQETSPTAELIPPSPADVINAVNSLRLSNGLNALTVHPVLMEVAAQQASALAGSSGSVGHARACGMTLGQQLLLLGFPLWGDLSLDGYRSENWGIATSVEEIIVSWLRDDLHTNTMLSEFRSDIGAAVVVGDQIYFVIETALRTNTGQHQTSAYPILTAIPVTQAACLGQLTPNADGTINQYSIPVAVSTARPDGDVVHEVQYGQTLWDLAIQYKVSIEQIKFLNNLTDDTIAPGWKLLIQKAATQPVPVTPTLPSGSLMQTSTLYVLPTWTPMPSPTSTSDEATLLVEGLGENKVVVAALILSFSVLVAGVIGFGKKKAE